MKIIIDNKIPLLKGLLEPWADVEYVQGEKISKEILQDADAMLIRTRTLCNADLLRGSDVKFIGTATIGTDHIDTDWCNKNGIFVASAPGCNSGSVMQYMCSALLYLIQKYNIQPEKTTTGIIGVGNVGSKVADMAKILGFNVLLNDPPRERAEKSNIFASLDDLLNTSDIVSIHVPLTLKGIDRTIGLADSGFFNKIRKNSFLINTSRGAVIDEGILLREMERSKIKAAILDVWNNEPLINRALLRKADIGTPHIAGYSSDGKANGSAMIIRQLAEFFDLPLKEWKPAQLKEPERQLIDIDKLEGNDLEIISNVVMHTYNIENDSRLLKDRPEQFEKLRGDYPDRREFHAYKVKGDNKLLINRLRALGFR